MSDLTGGYDYAAEPEAEEAALTYQDQVTLPDVATVAKVTQAFNHDGTVRKIIKATKADFISTLIYLDGKPFSFEGRGYLKPIYNIDDSRLLLKTGRQVEKTTCLANNLVVTSAVIPYSKSLYVSPSHMQTRQFSNEKLRPAIEKSPFIRRYFQDTAVSAQVFEKGFTNGSYIFLRSAFRSADRCLARGSKILLTDGHEVSVEDAEVGNQVVSFDGAKSVVRHIIGKTANGSKECLRLELESGHALEASFDHRFFTSKGIKRLDQLQAGDSIPIPLGHLTAEGVADDPVPLWVGLLLGDGCIQKLANCNAWRCEFSNNDLGLISIFRGLCDRLGVDYRLSERMRNGKASYTVCTRTQSRIQEILGPLGLLGKDQFTKFIPEPLLRTKSYAKDVLRGLFESDGWVTANTRTRQFEVGFVSGSELLARGVQRALQSLGVYSQLLKRQPRGRQRSVYWLVKVRHTAHVLRFAATIGLLSKNEKLQRAVAFIIDQIDSRCSGHDVPAREDCAAALESAGISSHTLWTSHQISFRNNRWAGDRIAQQKVRRIWEITGDRRLEKWIDESVTWVKVKATEAVGVKETWDLEIEGDPYFTANGMFTHNTRGISVSAALALDEIQDFLGAEIPVIMECTSHYPQSRIIMAGTPKSFDNPIELYWQETTQNEWLVPCGACGKWNFLDEGCIGPTEDYVSRRLPPGPICKKCRKPIDVTKGQWICFDKSKPIRGYRIPQLMVPWIVGLYDQWLKLLWKRDNYPFGQFNNEVLGLSHDSASKPVSRDDLMDCCGDYDLWDSDNITTDVVNAARQHILIGGVDWGEGNDGSERSPTGKLRNASYTVFTIGSYVTSSRFEVKLIKKYMGKETDPEFCTRDIARICNTLGVQLVGADWGHGWGPNNTLVRLLGPSRVIQFQYLPKLKLKMKWDPIGVRYHLQRNFIMSEVFFDIKNRFIGFPRWRQFERFAKEILAIFAEYVEYRREIKFDHRPSDPDDFFHALTFCKIAADIYFKKDRRYTMQIDASVEA